MPNRPVENEWSTSRVLVAIINLALGLFLWLTDFTNVSIAGYAEFLFPIFVGLIGYISYRFLKRKEMVRRQRLLLKFASLPSLLGGVLSLIAYIPPMLFYSLLMINNASTELQTQAVFSPDGLNVAKVYIGRAGFVDAEDKISIRISPRWLPIIEKEVFVDVSESGNWCGETAYNCIQWQDNSNIMLIERMESIPTDAMEFSLPPWLLASLLVFYSLAGV